MGQVSTWVYFCGVAVVIYLDVLSLMAFLKTERGKKLVGRANDQAAAANQRQQEYAAARQAQQAYQPPYQAPYQPMPVYGDTREVTSVGSYIGMFILSAIPIVNIICWIVWLVSPKTNKNKKNFLKACIIMWIIMVVLAGALGFSVYTGTSYLSGL